MKSSRSIFCDWKANRGIQVKLTLVLFRLCNRLSKGGSVSRLLGLPCFVFYKMVVVWLFHIDIPWHTEIGTPLIIFHPFGIVVNGEATLGSNIVLRHNITVGNKVRGGPSPVIGDYVDIGSGAVILGDINVGSCSCIGANAVVVKDVEPYMVVAGNPARCIKMLSAGDNHEKAH